MREYLGDRVVAQDAFIRKTRSVCPSCMQELNADILCKDGVVVMQKHCPEHGDCSVILSREVRYYSELARAYFAIMPKNMATRFIAVTLTPRCTLNCPVCFAVRTIGQKIREITTKDLEKMIAQNPGKEFLLWGMEPTEHPQIVEILRLLTHTGQKPHDGVPVHAGHPLGRPDAVSLDQGADDGDLLVELQGVHAQRLRWVAREPSLHYFSI